MEYIKAINDNFNLVQAQLQGKFVQYKMSTDGTVITCGFSNTPLRTASGREFRVMGVAEWAYVNGQTVTWILAMELKPNFAAMNWATENIGDVFIISPHGRFQRPGISSIEKEIFWSFKMLADLYKQKYQEVPSFLMFLTEEQRNY